MSRLSKLHRGRMCLEKESAGDLLTSKAKGRGGASRNGTMRCDAMRSDAVRRLSEEQATARYGPTRRTFPPTKFENPSLLSKSLGR